ncbi:hypothetical protein NC652_003838 [Populus alba x Populus x berolinensis]|uniref:Uncharacterized protein n=1 Tax=Populus alba x Populus x berolinensis TaxID=444605 RepID=A0AAD6WIT7_9ROSI|nr:hypothetical protein NC651_003717 [Populus alba x Populus x berolinensis]KAJ6966073.1 hypothetical protein NC652_003838 [Populus alba x Populus x berolinensis]KAJ7014375.1 hypothetical protein NC653_003864 [Populus alba x Populus x berolinensis]
MFNTWDSPSYKNKYREIYNFNFYRAASNQ